MKVCTKCKNKKFFDKFSLDNTRKGNIYRSWCKQCEREYRNIPEVKQRRKDYFDIWNKTDEARKYKREYAQKYYIIPENRIRQRKSEIRSNLKRWYGITIEEKRQMWIDQKGKCKVLGCRRELDTALESCIDHNHITKKVRGLICRNCNFIIGHAHDDIKILEGIIDYLEKYD